MQPEASVPNLLEQDVVRLRLEIIEEMIRKELLELTNTEEESV